MKQKPQQLALIIGAAIVILLFGVFMMLTVPEVETEEALPQTIDLQ